MGPRPSPMTRTRIPVRHWRTYGDYPLPTGAEALDGRSSASVPNWLGCAFRISTTPSTSTGCPKPMREIDSDTRAAIELYKVRETLVDGASRPND